MSAYTTKEIVDKIHEFGRAKKAVVAAREIADSANLQLRAIALDLGMNEDYAGSPGNWLDGYLCALGFVPSARKGGVL